MKKLLAILLAAVMMISLTACGGDEGTAYEIPDVFGLTYTDAITLLEAEGFEVSAVETGVDSFSTKLLYPLEKVDKGIVFKIDDYIIDNNGNLNKGYSLQGTNGPVSADKSVVIYYAKEDYVLEEGNESNTPENSTTTTTTTKAPTTTTTTKAASGGLDPDFKAAMDSYEKFMDEYVAFMKKYQANPSDFSLLADYADYMSKYADFVEDFEKWDDEDMNAAETAYYLEVQTRVNKKLLDVVG